MVSDRSVYRPTTGGTIGIRLPARTGDFSLGYGVNTYSEIMCPLGGGGGGDKNRQNLSSKEGGGKTACFIFSLHLHFAFLASPAVYFVCPSHWRMIPCILDTSDYYCCCCCCSCCCCCCCPFCFPYSSLVGTHNSTGLTNQALTYSLFCQNLDYTACTEYYCLLRKTRWSGD